MFSNAVELYTPINTYKPLAERIGIVDGPLVYMTYPVLRFLTIPFPTRMTVIRLDSGDLLLHSPTVFDEPLAAALCAMGPVRHIVSPNLIHYAHVAEWADRFPDAVVWASPRVRERAQSQGVAVHFDDDLGADAPAEWRDDLRQAVIPGTFVDEVVFFHIGSQTLVLTDTIQNFELDKIKQPYRALVWAARAYAPRGQMPIDLRSTFLPKKQQAGEVVRRILSWQPQRIIVSHGKCIEHDAEAALRFAFRWAL
jgi:hypothetical protein